MNGPRIFARLAVGLTVAALSLPAEAAAQEGGPLLKSDLVRMMTASNYTSTEMAAIVRMNCVGFEPTDRDRSQLRNLPNAAVVLAEVDRCMSRPKAAPAAATTEKVVQAPPAPSRRSIDLATVDFADAGPDLPALARPEGAASSLDRSQRTSVVEQPDPPELTNWKQVSSAFLREYRPNVRTPGTVLLWLRVAPDGTVAEARVKRATGDPVMADAALKITKVMVFKPATLRDHPVEGWTELPISYSSK